MKMDRGKYDHTHISMGDEHVQIFLYQYLCFLTSQMLFATVIKSTHVQH